jgi:hypothetical protein
MEHPMKTEKPPQKRGGCQRFFLYIILIALLLCVAAAVISAISNQSLPTAPADTNALTPADQARIAEAFHLKESFGEAVWPGWGAADIPVIVWNSDYAFLYNYPEQPPSWPLHPGELFNDRRVYRSSATAEMQAFTEEVVDGRWAGTISTKWEMDKFLMDQIRGGVPDPLEPVVPFRLLITESEVYMGGLLHETFHAYQATTWKDRFDDAEDAYPDGDRYWQVSPAMANAWAKEMGLLVDALEAASDASAADFARQFLAARAERRQSAGLDDSLILFEKRFEWLEGSAKYLEAAIYEKAATTPGYQPDPQMASDPEFRRYLNWNLRWSSEKFTMRSIGLSEGDVRFYYAGMAQARLLDRLMPAWKDRFGDEGVWLEDLLAEAVQ